MADHRATGRSARCTRVQWGPNMRKLVGLVNKSIGQ
jgi:hypothetical protein